ncbi:MAG: tRNA pseudouridine(38-40) synthase TruA [Phycisphaerales bacterium]|nr:tRNA pseudouridine(38-40) synthase TruA [Phycisphaerales bacterium]
MARYRLTLAYDGSAFHGWQKQHPSVPTAPDQPAPGETLRTVQAAVERAVAEAVRQPVIVMGSSRTDSGVHAQAQTAAFTVAEPRHGAPDDRLALAINARLPGDVLCLDCRRADPDFDPVSDCLAKGYRYTIAVGPTRPLWDRARALHVHQTLDTDAMDAAARLLVGEHDFAAFAAAGHGRTSTVRTMFLSRVARDAAEPDRIHIDVAAGGFLWNMVRIIVGTLIEVGRGRAAPDEIAAILASRDRQRAGPTVPPHGLCLRWGLFPGDPPPPDLDPSLLPAIAAAAQRKRARAAEPLDAGDPA